MSTSLAQKAGLFFVLTKSHGLLTLSPPCGKITPNRLWTGRVPIFSSRSDPGVVGAW